MTDRQPPDETSSDVGQDPREGQPGAAEHDGQGDVSWGGTFAESNERVGGTHVQAMFWAGIGLFLVVAGQIYGALSREQAGTILFTAAGILAFIVAAYLAFPRRHVVSGPRSQAMTARIREAREEPEQLPSTPESAWFPHSSIWPFAVGVGALLVANGLLLGLWLLLPAFAFLLFAVIGWLIQSRYRT